MKNFTVTLTAALCLIVSAFTLIRAENWKVAAGYSVKFDGKGASGSFSGLKGDIVFDEHDLAGSRFNVSVDVASINTGIGLKNKHAKGEKYFDAEKHPLIRFSSSSVKQTDKGYAAAGTLEIHGIRKEITLPFRYTKTATGALFTSSFEVNRNDFRIGGSSWFLGDVFKVELSVPVTK